MSSPLICNHFLKSKSNQDIILAFTLMISFFQQYDYSVQIIHSDHENTILSAQTFLNQQNMHLINMSENWNAMFKQLMVDFDLCY
jgi:hypothetical protein